MKMEQQAAKQTPSLHLLLIPYPAQGHLIPALDFARAIYDIHGAAVTVVLTTQGSDHGNLLQAPSTERNLVGAAAIDTLVLPLPSRNNKVDDEIYRRSFGEVMYGMADLHESILEWARTQPSPPDAIISDMFAGWTNRLAADLGIPRLVFCPSGAMAYLAANFLWKEMPRRSGSTNEPDGDSWPVTFSTVPGLPTFPWWQISEVYRSYREGDLISKFIQEGFMENARSWGLIVNTFESLEGKYLEGLKRDLGHHHVWSVGPVALNVSSSDHSAGLEHSCPSTTPSEVLLQWLDTCPDSSVIYISFGSQTVLDPPQMEAVAAALELSRVRFIWCTLTTGSGQGDAGVVPEGFEERNADRGVVVRGWAPQVALLGHSAVGSFLSHCGWNSVTEAIAAGVLVLTWPMGADQYFNARLVVDDLQVGVRACEGDVVPDPVQLAAVFSDSLGPNRADERERVLALKGKAAEAAMQETGTSRREMRALVEALGAYGSPAVSETKS